MSRSKGYKAIKNYIHNELGLTKEDIINAIRSDIRKYVEECICNTYGNDNNIEQMIKFMVDNELKNKIGGLFETDENGILTGRYFGRCNVKDYQNGYMPKGKKEIPCREIEISPDNWIMTVESNNEALIELSKIYDIVWRQCPCLKGIMNTNVTPELEKLACEQMKG